jgi:tape measure domain-containing protein
MATADDVIVEFEAKVDDYLVNLNKARSTFERSTGAQQARMQQFERQMKASSGQISNTLKGLAGAFAAAFSVRELAGLADSFTRLQNNLRVAGLEGTRLAEVQQNLLDISQRYGADLEGLTEVFLKASLAQNELGASTAQIIRLNEIVAASLKVTGTSAAQAQGALLQLGQALGSGVVRAEEVNSILEGALPLAQAAARGIDGFGGSVAKLRAAVADGQITSQQFFEGVLRGGVQTLADAEKATLTLAGGVTALRSALTVYFGEADKANGVSAALGEALGFLADNLDIIIPALATIATFLGVRYVAGAVAASAATTAFTGTLVGSAAAMGAMGAASFALQARLVGAATTMEAAAFAARGLGASLLAVFGGPIGAALIAVAGGLYLVHQRTKELDNATGRYKVGLDASNEITKSASDLAEKLATARGKERQATLEALRIEKARAEQALISAKNDIIAARAALARAAAVRQTQSERQGFARGIGGMGMDPGGISTSIAGIPERQAQANLAAAEQTAKNIESAIEQISAIIAGASGGVAVPGKKDKDKKPPKPSGPSEEELARDDARAAADLSRLRQEELRARQSLATSAEERADLEREILAEERDERMGALNAELDARAKEIKEAETLNAAQKKVRLDAIEAERRASLEFLERLYGPQASDGEIPVRPPALYQQAANREAARQLEQEAQDIAEERFRSEQEALQLAYDLATTEAQRRDLAHRILDAEDAYLRAKLEAVIASQTATEAEKERARIALEGLEGTAEARRAVADRAHQGPLGRYLDQTSDPRTAAEEAAVREIQNVRDGLAEGLAEQLGTKNQFVKDLFSIFLDQVIFRPIAEALAGAGGGGLGNIVGSVVGSIFGRATGGPVSGGRAYMVGENGREIFVPQQNGVVVPNHRLQANAQPMKVIVEVQANDYFDARVASVSRQVATPIAQQTAAQIGGAVAQGVLKAMPRRMAQFSRDGT